MMVVLDVVWMDVVYSGGGYSMVWCDVWWWLCGWLWYMVVVVIMRLGMMGVVYDSGGYSVAGCGV